MVNNLVKYKLRSDFLLILNFGYIFCCGIDYSKSKFSLQNQNFDHCLVGGIFSLWLMYSL